MLKYLRALYSDEVRGATADVTGAPDALRGAPLAGCVPARVAAAAAAASLLRAVVAPRMYEYLLGMGY